MNINENYFLIYNILTLIIQTSIFNVQQKIFIHFKGYLIITKLVFEVEYKHHQLLLLINLLIFFLVFFFLHYIQIISNWAPLLKHQSNHFLLLWVFFLLIFHYFYFQQQNCVFFHMISFYDHYYAFFFNDENEIQIFYYGNVMTKIFFLIAYLLSLNQIIKIYIIK